VIEWVAQRPGNGGHFHPRQLTKTAVEMYLTSLEQQGFSQMRKRAYLNCELTIRVSRHSPFLRIESLFCQIRRQ
jgi:hypothetical protein